MEITALYFDGQHSKIHTVTMIFTADQRLLIPEHAIDLPISEITIRNRLGNTPRIIELPDGARCKVPDNDQLDTILNHLAIKQGSIHRWERSWKLALGSIALIAVFIVFMLTAGADYSAALIARIIPDGTLDGVSRTTLAQLDKHYLHPSKLSETKKQHILKLFDTLTQGESRYQLHFRSSPELGPNAFALPSGDIVLLDELVLLDTQKDLHGLLGVLAHEKGHIVYRHTLKAAIKGTVAAAIIGYFTGDATFIASTLPTLMISAQYSRTFEREADLYAKRELDRLQISSRPLADLFAKLDRNAAVTQTEHNHSHSAKTRFRLPDWISTHPPTKERIDFFMQDPTIPHNKQY